MIPCLMLIAGTTIISLIIPILIYFLRFRTSKNVAYVIVLGDVGRSPRMQYHALSLAQKGFQVLFFGFAGSTPHRDVLYNKSIQLVHLLPTPEVFKKLPSSLSFVAKVIWQSLVLFTCLTFYRRPSHVLIQNPPAIPTILVSLIACRLRGSRLIIDWHNYGYSIMALTLKNPQHPLVRVYKWYERKIGCLADSHTCVTDAMKEDLMQNWQIRAVTVHDKPASIFKRLTMLEKHTFFQSFDPFRSPSPSSSFSHNIFTKMRPDGDAEFSEGRPVLIISSTSWTPDEDFNVLLEALEAYEALSSPSSSSLSLPPIVCVVTGKGPLKSHYTKLISEINWVKVKIVTPWLSAEDYPTMLGCGDLGVCLHYSSSGLDLPMKVVDMFGCHLPVCAVRYKCINELVVEGKSGWLFDDSKQLCQLFLDLLKGFTTKSRRLEESRDWLRDHPIGDWDSNWKRNVDQLFN
ncbi:hypothetical protein HELRODRAFT_101462 [Helobdella robusta]|uniref:Chitobiosyldiphosphodolichol beta-mannosyltransferase n=1 Tax=Helobdella robusta TaxID=6412 RepID=T1ED48_HELRO|nr:hypothetical protein HELRODRAFT_101462 [Helobdella robusta]ESN99850.1 hypothetical protein HELRODRAFT_101462 [Helobdella robusta]